MRWLADENFNNDIIRGLRRRAPGLDILRVRDVGLAGRDDEAVLAWAAAENRLLLTHDVATITDYTYHRAMEGHWMPGVFEVPRRLTRNTGHPSAGHAQTHMRHSSVY